MKKIFNRKFFTLPITLTATLAILAIVSGIFLTTKQNITSDNKKVQQVNLQKDSSKKAILSKEKASNSDVVSNIESTPTLTPTIAVYNNSNQQQQSSSPTAIPTLTSAPTIVQNQVSLVINGSSSFTVTVNEGANQCDVLQNALSQGKISSLNMRYDNNLGTYGVYQINGIGKDNSISWIYKVNEEEPSKGCSYIKANNNDNIVWTYLGS